jgi:hypothetical protein
MYEKHRQWQIEFEAKLRREAATQSASTMDIE